MRSFSLFRCYFSSSPALMFTYNSLLSIHEQPWGPLSGHEENGTNPEEKGEPLKRGKLLPLPYHSNLSTSSPHSLMKQITIFYVNTSTSKICNTPIIKCAAIQLLPNLNFLFHRPMPMEGAFHIFCTYFTTNASNQAKCNLPCAHQLLLGSRAKFLLFFRRK